MDRTKLHFETLQLHVGQENPDPTTDARAVPIYQTTSYVFHDSAHAAARFSLEDSGNIYGRLTNPTQSVLEQRVAALEGGVAALAVASGAAAISYAFENITRTGDHIVSARTIYGGTYNLLAHTFPSRGIHTTFVDAEEPANVEQAIQPNTKAIFIESLGNPNCTLVDIARIAEIAHRHQIPLLIDNTFATPYLLRPIEYGADIVIHSATKFIGGHGTSLGGIRKNRLEILREIIPTDNSRPMLPRTLLCRCGKSCGLYHPNTCYSVTRYRSCHQSVQCLPPSARTGNPLAQSGTSRRECAEGSRLPAAPS